MGTHLIDGEFQSDKYPTTPRGKVPLSVKDPMAQDLLWEYAQRRRAVDAEFSADLETALKATGFRPLEQVRKALRGEMGEPQADILDRIRHIAVKEDDGGYAMYLTHADVVRLRTMLEQRVDP